MIKSYADAIRETLDELMASDEKIILMGEDIAEYGGCFGVTRGLLEKYGAARVINTPMSEQAIVGLSTGAAIKGLKPIAEIMFMDFMTLTYDQLLNHASIFDFLTNGDVKVPTVIRTPNGAGRGYGATHSKTIIAPLMHIPGIKIVAPSNPNDARALLKSSIEEKCPVIFVESKLLYHKKGEIDPSSVVPLGSAKVCREGKDLSIITFGKNVQDALQLAEKMEPEGISIEVVDLRTLKPLDKETISNSVSKTRKAVIVEEGYKTCGVASEIISCINENCFYNLDAPPKRICSLEYPLPCAPTMESKVIPSIERIEKAVREVFDA